MVKWWLIDGAVDGAVDGARDRSMYTGIDGLIVWCTCWLDVNCRNRTIDGVISVANESLTGVCTQSLSTSQLAIVLVSTDLG